MNQLFKRAAVFLLSLLCLSAGGCFYQGYSSYRALDLSDEKGRKAGLEMETEPEPECPEGYWLYDGQLFEQQAQPDNGRISGKQKCGSNGDKRNTPQKSGSYCAGPIDRKTFHFYSHLSALADT